MIFGRFETCGASGGSFDALKNSRAMQIHFFAGVNDALKLFAESVDARVRMLPGMNHGAFIERAGKRANFGELKEARAGGNQQANGELDGRDVFDKRILTEAIEEIEVPFDSGPRSEGDEGRLKSEADFTEEADDGEKIGACVMLFELREDGVVHRFDGAGDEEAAGAAESLQMGGMLEEMLDLNGDVVSEARKILVQGFDERDGVANAIEKIGVAERDVGGAGGDLLANVDEDDVTVHDAENAVVNGNDRAMATQVFAAAAGFGVTDDPAFAIGKR